MFSHVQWVEVGVLLAPVEYSQGKETLGVLSLLQLQRHVGKRALLFAGNRHAQRNDWSESSIRVSCDPSRVFLL